ncbi:hypothetical protein [Tenacibaculum finnmarkense]|uniref:Internalin-J n=1 Tax=Tenacibaculum finnmarkense genomovar ulcerans TaxID=2781388 RepID=A0A2I2MC35_9FLAO|nr:hypothetical protein [Tenacibaculum finnmarkense]MBE7649307.1 hypothetical protein [Tenacibaculum finnmarkense genomovar ulcerans]SOU89484.1 conserved hypothetical protein [Tenacibaculum finnmarkense genomovar ulcerans]
MGMASSRRYGGQEITMVTTSNASDWKVSKDKSQRLVKWSVLGKLHTQEVTQNGVGILIIDFSGNTGSETVVVTSSRGLTKFYCNRIQLTALDVSRSISLENLYCFNNRLTELDVSKNDELIYIHCANNQLKVLDVSKNVKLRQLICFNNRLTTLDVSKNVKLTHLSCTNNPTLTTIYVNQNQLNILNGVAPQLIAWDWLKPAHTKYILKQ